MMAGMLAVYAPAPCTLSGALSASGAGATVTGTARTLSVPAGNGGVLIFSSYVNNSGSTQYKKNAGAFTTFVDSTEVTFADTDTITIQGITMTAATSNTFNLVDKKTGRTIQAVTITRN